MIDTKLQQIIDNLNAEYIIRDGISTSIRGKSVEVPEGAKLEELSGYIDIIPQGEAPKPTPTGLWLNLVTLSDSEGYIVTRIPISRGETVTLPDIDIVPESTVFDENWHPEMKFTNWVYPYGYITNNQITIRENQVTDVTVGAMYTTNENTATYLILNIPSDNYILYNTNFNNAFVNWGDGSTSYGGNHTYAKRGLYKVTVDNPSQLVRLNNRTVAMYSSTNLKYFGSGAFQNCFLLKTLSLSSNVEDLPFNAFSQCYSLSGIILPPLNSIGQTAFRSCYNMEYVIFSPIVTTFGKDCFSGCSSWALVTFPEFSTSTASGMFGEVGVSKIEFNTDLTAILDYTFYLNDGCYIIILNSSTPPALGTNRATPNVSCIYVVPEGSRDAYIAATNWAPLAPYIVENTAEFRNTFNF